MNMIKFVLLIPLFAEAPEGVRRSTIKNLIVRYLINSGSLTGFVDSAMRQTSLRILTPTRPIPTEIVRIGPRHFHEHANSWLYSMIFQWHNLRNEPFCSPCHDCY